MGRTLTRPRSPAVLALLVLATGCPDERPRTQVMVIFEADRLVENVAEQIEIEVYAEGAGEALPSVLVQSLRLDFDADFDFPVSHAVVPRDDREPGEFRIEGRLIDAQRDEPIAHVRAIAGFVRGETRALRLRFHARCLYVAACAGPSESCGVSGDCAPQVELPEDLPPLGSVPDAGPEPLCRTDLDCDDGVACTDDACVSGSCLRVPNDARCTAMSGGTCHATAGCQYGACTTASCVPEGCDETATCTGPLCARTSQCRLGEGCCGATCVAPACNDGDACTVDACGASGACTHAFSSRPCDDGVFCNGLDSCGTAGCDAHAGDPCGGSASCDEAVRSCTGCASDADCPADRVATGTCVPDASAPCGGGAGTRSETVTSYTCTSGTCVRARGTTPMASCTPPPLADGAVCGTSMEGIWGPCMPASGDPCDPDGIESRMVVARACTSGACVPGLTTLETRACVRTPTGCSMDAGADAGRDAGVDGGPDGGIDAIVAVSSGYDHTCAVDGSGTLYCWGRNVDGRIGDGTTTDRPRPTVVTGLGAVPLIVEAATAHTCAIDDASVWCWGEGLDYQLGDGVAMGRVSPVAVSGLTSARGLAGGDIHTCAVLGGGAVACWGRNANGQLGDGTGTDHPTPNAVTGLGDAVEIASGAYHTCALRPGGLVSCWGGNAQGELGDGTTSPIQYAPVSVVGLSGATAIAAGLSHNCTLDASGQVSCWGYNVAGQLGDGTMTTRRTAVPVAGVADATAIAAGGSHTCAIRTDGSVVCWGDNGNGQLGDGTTTASTSPVRVAGVADAVAIAAGRAHTCARRPGRTVVCWGDNSQGQLGDGTTIDASAPVPVVFP